MTDDRIIFTSTSTSGTVTGAGWMNSGAPISDIDVSSQYPQYSYSGTGTIRWGDSHYKDSLMGKEKKPKKSLRKILEG